MEETLSLSWDAHQNNICSGLSLLQQRGEFVDMTLAADGHHLKVHQMVMSLASPYIKELISSAQCPHPVVFLNNISYTTLCAILEYIYTGEVLLPKEKLPDLLAAGRALHIKGLREMDEVSPPQSDALESSPPKASVSDESPLLNRDCIENKKHNVKRRGEPKPMHEVFVTSSDHDNDNDNDEDMEIALDVDKPYDKEQDVATLENIPSEIKAVEACKTKQYKDTRTVQYSISNQGGLQVIINRYIYNLKYVQKNLNKYWRCVDYAYLKCPANVYTNGKNEVLRRRCTHNHPFHDGKIIKKVRLGTIFSAFNEAETCARDKKTGDDVFVLPRAKTSKKKDSD